MLLVTRVCPIGPSRCRLRSSLMWSRSMSKDRDVLTIGDVSLPLKSAKKPSNVPRLYAPSDLSKLSSSTLSSLQWLIRKDVLNQDAFLLGRAGSHRRRLVLMYLELTQREYEHVVLSRDTTESDLKQRREIINNTAVYVDQPAVKAAVHGRVLLLEGIEKVERNVLPVLNNLLENREMHLEDGRLLIPSWRYDKIEEASNNENGDDAGMKSHLVRVSPEFRVIALGLPVPKYAGNPLDPPLRSRFQARNIQPIPFKQFVDFHGSELLNLPSDQLSQLASFGHTLLVSDESSNTNLPDFPMDNLPSALRLLDQTGLPPSEVISRLYPFELFLSSENKVNVKRTLDKFELAPSNAQTDIQVAEVAIGENKATVQVDVGSRRIALEVGCGVDTLAPSSSSASSSSYVSSTYHDALLSELMLSHSIGDFCIVGPRGCGKSRLISQFAELLDYGIEPILLYQDMTARDLLQQRTTTQSGDTIWQLSPLIKAAKEGKLAVLDGLHRLHRGTLAVIQSLVQDRELQLYDGTRLIRHDRFDHLVKETGLDAEALREQHGVIRIHPNFRIAALAEPPPTSSAAEPNAKWMTSETLATFLFHSMRSMSKQEEMALIKAAVSSTAPSSSSSSHVLDEVLRVTHVLRQSEDASMRSVANALTTRQLLRVAKRLVAFPSMETTTSIIEKACLSKFLPSLPRDALHEILTRELKDGLETTRQRDTEEEDPDANLKCVVHNDVLTIGNTSAPIYREGADLSKVPDTVFYETKQNVKLLEALLQDFVLGEHLLLVGNQGVGKNKLVDRLLHLLHRPREYIQLHRDSSVQSLTLAPTVRDGVIVYEDSPLVKAASLGHVLVVDEADKAPTHVTCVLKTLVESGEMSLADGRRISSHVGRQHDSNVITLHPDFRMIVLANRPGFPFLGNDFFAAMGDLFSAHGVDNPSLEAELAMLRQYGPNVSEQVLRQLVAAFSELRHMADDGLIGYPYSTREVVNIVKHLEMFRDDSVAAAVRNVFDFDAHQQDTKEIVIDVLHKHGIPLGVSSRSVFMASEFELAAPELFAHWTRSENVEIKVEKRGVHLSDVRRLPCHHVSVDRSSARGSSFSEQHSFWRLPMSDNSVVSDLAVLRDEHQRQLYDLLLVTTTNPLSLIASRPIESQVTVTSLGASFAPRIQRRFAPQMAVAPLPTLMQGESMAILHEELSHALAIVNPLEGMVREVMSEEPGSNILKSVKNFMRLGDRERRPPTFKMIATIKCSDDISHIWFHVPNSSLIEQFVLKSNHEESFVRRLTLPFHVRQVMHMGDEQFVLTSDDEQNTRYLLNRDSELVRLEEKLVDSRNDKYNLTGISTSIFNPNVLTGVNVEKAGLVNNRVGSSDKHHGLIMVDSKEFKDNELWVWPKSDEVLRVEALKGNKRSSHVMETSSNVVFLPSSGQIVQSRSSDELPREYRAESLRHERRKTNDFIEVADLFDQKLRYIPVPETHVDSLYASWFRSNQSSRLMLEAMSNEGLVSVDNVGMMRLWETGVANLHRSLSEWRQMTERESRQLTISRDKVGELSTPKHGKLDPKNTPHVGGDTWAGGTGGRSTAGLGGVGGPYRLDAGHDVHQVAEELKTDVPEHILQAAREMNRQAFEERLREIKMSEHDAELYAKYSANVSQQVQTLRTIIDGLQAKSKERQWLKNRTSGELDDAKLIEGIAGEKTIYRQRGEPQVDPHAAQEKPKRLRILADVSGSMYRFNGHDQRLERSLESVLMVMEALDGYERRLQYDVIGHSGEEAAIPFVAAGKAPKNEKQRLQILKSMHAHSQFCFSGDHTLDATALAINELAREREQFDECFVVVLSDANFDRYGISPRQFGQVLLRQSEHVPAFAIFIGSLGDQATMLTRNLPAGKAFVCLDTAKIPNTLKAIFSATMLH